jgi:hypothetical protein
MTEQEINNEIAKFHGWKREFNGDHEDPEWYWIPPNNPDGNGNPPNYCGDLNLMREAERYLDDDQWLEYMLNLQHVLQRDPYRGKWIVCQDNMHSTAAQRAKAFVITIGKCKE